MRWRQGAVGGPVNRRHILGGAALGGAALLAPGLASRAFAHMAGADGCGSTGEDERLNLDPADGNIQEMAYSDGKYITSYVIFELGPSTIQEYQFDQFEPGEISITNLGMTPVYLAAKNSDVHRTHPADRTPFSRPIESMRAAIATMGSGEGHTPVLYVGDGHKAGPLVLFQIKDGQNVAGTLQLPGPSGARWEPYDYPDGSALEFPLWISPFAFLDTTIHLDPWAVTRTAKPTGAPATIGYKVCTNLWWLPANSDAAIHNKHYANFLELHTQLLGAGRMQKFTRSFQYVPVKNPDGGGSLSFDPPKGSFFNTGEDGTAFPDLYEEFRMTPPDTNLPFPIMSTDGTLEACEYNEAMGVDVDVDHPCFYYPWHQYYADTDCLWVAFEYHQVPA